MNTEKSKDDQGLSTFSLLKQAKALFEDSPLDNQVEKKEKLLNRLNFIWYLQDFSNIDKYVQVEELQHSKYVAIQKKRLAQKEKLIQKKMMLEMEKILNIKVKANF